MTTCQSADLHELGQVFIPEGSGRCQGVAGLRFCVRALLAGRAELTSWLLSPRRRQSRASGRLVQGPGPAAPAAQRRREASFHCAAVNPSRLCDARQQLGIPQPTMMSGLYFAIPLERIMVHRVVWYSGKTLWINGAPDEDVPLVPPDDEFEPFNPQAYRELSEPTPAHLAYLKRMKHAGKRPLMFVHIPHILVAGPIDVSGLTPICWQQAAPSPMHVWRTSAEHADKLPERGGDRHRKPQPPGQAPERSPSPNGLASP
jgi:hypothetical protein